MKISARRVGLALSLSLFCPVLLAHPGHGAAIAGGILHPLTGLDHLWAMAGIGVWAARQNGHARWLIPGSFLALMAIAAWFGTLGHTPTFTEQGIAASVFLIGLLISFSANMPAPAGMLIAGMFAIIPWPSAWGRNPGCGRRLAVRNRLPTDYDHIAGNRFLCQTNADQK